VPESTLEPLITECPNCRTRFRVSEAQLAKASGRVRCGACLSVFQATDRLVFGSATSLEPKAPERDLDKLLAELNRAENAERRQPEGSGGPRAMVPRRVLGAVPVGRSGEAAAHSAARVPGGTRGSGVKADLTKRPASRSSEQGPPVAPERTRVSDAGGPSVRTGTESVRPRPLAENVQRGTLTEGGGDRSIADVGQRPATAPDQGVVQQRDPSVGATSRASIDAGPAPLTEAASTDAARIAEHGRARQPTLSDGETRVRDPLSRGAVERRAVPVELPSTAGTGVGETSEVDLTDTSTVALVVEGVRVLEPAPAHLVELGPRADALGRSRDAIGHGREAPVDEQAVGLPADIALDGPEIEAIELSAPSSAVPEGDAPLSVGGDASVAAPSSVCVPVSELPPSDRVAVWSEMEESARKAGRVLDSPEVERVHDSRVHDSRGSDVRVPDSRDRRGDRRTPPHDGESGDTGVLASASPLALSLEADLRAERPRRRRWWMPVAIVAAAAVLVGQVFWFQFDEWSRDLRFRPIYQEICVRVGCRLPVMRALESIQSRNLVVRSHPNVAGALLVDALIINDAAFPQPFPQSELRFSSLTGSLVAGRRFKPSEYLSGELAGAEMMQPNTPVHIALEIDDPGTEAVNYVMVFR
jgi:predicted Zn finger-like uncharacterized protein